jgi:hypothetical protein
MESNKLTETERKKRGGGGVRQCVGKNAPM